MTWPPRGKLDFGDVGRAADLRPEYDGLTGESTREGMIHKRAVVQGYPARALRSPPGELCPGKMEDIAVRMVETLGRPTRLATPGRSPFTPPLRPSGRRKPMLAEAASRRLAGGWPGNYNYETVSPRIAGV